MMNNAVQLTLSLGLTAPSWLVMSLIGVVTGTGITTICRLGREPKARIPHKSALGIAKPLARTRIDSP